ncbi:hypothetical protein [Gimesia panareensis]|uniref:hypothetical protein n=1 Tax=Gimesia panareensis TaxID=2527978 RepID=UPI001189DBA5|nr:hypothetical protein [Gimesia panareensis]QDU53108.1 hypothetical protein Pan110_54920 [Gimesia panareensis]
MAKDKKFQIQEIRNGYGDKAYWRSVVLPSVSKKFHKRPKTCVLQLQRRWRDLLPRLREAGYEPARKHFVFGRNCPPVSVATDQRSYGCRLYKICPFCWGRHYTFKVWNHLMPVMFPAKNQLSTGGGVLLFRQSPRFSDLDQACTTAVNSRLTELNVLQKQGLVINGSFVFTFVGIHPDVEKWVTWRSGIALLGSPYKDQLKASNHPEYFPHVKKSQLVDLVVKAMPYPYSVFTAEPDRLVECLEATKSMRYLSFRGSLR